jgi:Flp pilus assembly protein CpaB
VRLRRIPFLYWIVAACLAACTAMVIAKMAASAQARAAYWGRTAEVPVATAEIPAGQEVGADDFELRLVPVSVLPDSPVVDDPVGLVATETLVVGDFLVEARLGPAGVTGAAALLQPGERAVAMSRDAAMPPLEVGDRVDLVATFADGATGATGGTLLAGGCLVVDTGEEAVTVAVPASAAANVAAASGQGVLAIVLSSPAEPGSAAPAGSLPPWLGAGGSHGEHDGAGDHPVHDERGEAAAADEAQQTPHGSETGDAGGGHAHREGATEAGRQPPAPQ